MSQHKVLRFDRNLTNMLSVRERAVRTRMYDLRSYYAHGCEEESQEADDVQGRREAEGGEEDEEEISYLRNTAPLVGWRCDGDLHNVSRASQP